VIKTIGNLRLISGTSNQALADAISRKLNVSLTPVKISKFIDGESYARILEKVRGEDVFIIQPTCYPVNDHLMELLILTDAVRRASAGRINLVIPFFGYARQDRKNLEREAITAKLVANLITVAGANRVIIVDIHSDQIEGFFDIPVDHIRALSRIAKYFKKLDLRDFVVVAPDEGSVKVNNKLSQILGVPLVVISKQRDKTKVDSFEHIMLLGDVKGKNVIIIDDEINTGGTIVRAAELLKKHGAKEVYVSCTHAILAGPAIERLEKAPIKEVVVTDTIPLPEEKRIGKIKVLSLAPILAKTIKAIHEDTSLGKVLEEWRKV